MSESDVAEEERGIFRPFTRETLAAIDARIAEENERKKNQPAQTDDEFLDEPQEDPLFEAGMPLPNPLQEELPEELVATPLEDIDKYYQNQKVREKKSSLYYVPPKSDRWCIWGSPEPPAFFKTFNEVPNVASSIGVI